MNVPVGDNIVARKEDNKIVIEVDITKTLGVSSTGKTELVATTRSKFGAEVLPDLMLTLNMYKRLPKAQRKALLG